MEQEDTLGLSQELLTELERGYAGNSIAETRLLKVMLELVKCERADFLLLRDDDIRKWWGKLLSESESRLEQRKRRWSDYRIKVIAYERLTAEERRALGIRKPTKPSGPEI